MKKPPPAREQMKAERRFFISPELQPEGGPSFAEQLEEAQSQPRALFAGKLKPTPGGDIILNRAEPYSIAKEFIRREYCKYGHLGLYYKGEAFWQFNGSCYEELEFAVLSAEVFGFLNRAKCYINNNPVSIIVKPDDVNDIMKCIKAGTTIPAKLPQPCWIDTETPAPELFAFKNKLINVRTGETFDPTPRLWITDAVDFNYDENAECPRWERFLKEIQPDDPDAQNCIEEQLGYGMTYDMHFDKIAAWFGKPRAGKSTLLHIQEKLIGSRAFAPMSFHDWMRGEFSRENMIGKKVVAFSDVRLKPPRVYGSTGYDPGGLDHRSVQELLKISGRDASSLGVKYKKAWEGKPTCKIIITSNHALNIQDPILLTRLVMVDFQQSWLDRSDRDDHLREKLDAELPGIANRCLAAYRRLLERKRFIQPASASGLARRVAALTNPIAAFMQDCWVVDNKAKGPVAAEIKYSFDTWCEGNHRVDLVGSYPRNELIKAIKAIDAYSWLHNFRAHGDVRRYPGIRPRTSADRRKDEEAEE
jgi:putative DNA primase/helicase